MQKLNNLGTSWCNGRLIGFPRQMSRVHQNPTRCGVLIALTNSVEFRHAKDVKTLKLWIV
jgi:hypothetical protein